MKIRVEIVATYNTQTPVKALASVIVEEAFIIRNVKLVSRNGKTFASMPSQTNKRGARYDICHPIKTETREALDAAYIEAYNGYLAAGGLSA